MPIAPFGSDASTGSSEPYFGEADSLPASSEMIDEQECQRIKLWRLQRGLWMCPHAECHQISVRGQVKTVLYDTLLSI